MIYQHTKYKRVFVFLTAESEKQDKIDQDRDQLIIATINSRVNRNNKKDIEYEQALEAGFGMGDQLWHKTFNM